MKSAKWLLVLLPIMLLATSSQATYKHLDQAGALQLQNQLRFYLNGADRKGITRLIQQGANPNTRDSEGYSALDYAVSERDYPLLRALIRAGATLNHKDSGGWTPLLDVISITGGCGSTTDYDMAVFLLAHGAHAGVSNGKHTPLLDSAAMVDFASDENLRLIPILLRHGANPSRRNEKGLTAYDLVAHSFGVEPKHEKQRQHVLALLKAAMKKYHA